jgi:hypothetical protein
MTKPLTKKLCPKKHGGNGLFIGGYFLGVMVTAYL